MKLSKNMTNLEIAELLRSVAAAYQLSKKYPFSSWFVYPMPDQTIDNYSSGVQQQYFIKENWQIILDLILRIDGI